MGPTQTKLGNPTSIQWYVQMGMATYVHIQTTGDDEA